MSDPRGELLDRIVDDVAANGLGDRSLRDLAAAVGSSHRMLLYHFGSRPGLVAAIVDTVEARQRQLLVELAAGAPDAQSLVLALWERVSAPEVRPFVRLFFESVAASATPGDDHLTQTWLEGTEAVSAQVGTAFDPVAMRLGVAVVRGLLVDVLASGDVAPATTALERFVDTFYARAPETAGRPASNAR
jgi:AcrR family transcriptional regulator